MQCVDIEGPSNLKDNWLITIHNTLLDPQVSILALRRTDEVFKTG